MRLHQIVRQLMRNDNPPIARRLLPPLGIPTLHLLLMQLREEAEVAEDAAVLVERDGGARFVVEDVHCLSRKGVDVTYVIEEDGEGVQG